MIQHISFWIGEEPLTDDDVEGNPLKVQVRKVKRAVVCSMMEQMVNCYANDKECNCEFEAVDCTCFVVVNNRVPNRVSELHLMAARLHYGSSTNNAKNPKASMRMQQTRILWKNTGDRVMIRNAALLYAKTERWAARADAGLSKLGTLLNLDIVEVQSEEKTTLFDDSDEESSVTADLENMNVASTSATSTQIYNVDQGSVEKEIQKMLKLPGDHFVKCEYSEMIFLSSKHSNWQWFKT